MALLGLFESAERVMKAEAQGGEVGGGGGGGGQREIDRRCQSIVFNRFAIDF